MITRVKREARDRLLADGLLRVTVVAPGLVVATCGGIRDGVRLGYRHGAWHCSCPSESVRCDHLGALRHVVPTPDES